MIERGKRTPETSWRHSDLQEEASVYLAGKCKDNNCELKKTGNLSTCLIVNVEKYWKQKKKTGKVSDFLFLCSFSQRKKITVVELKSHSPHIPDLFEKIDNVCISICEFVKETALKDFDFYPVLLSKSMGPTETKLLSSLRKVRIGNCSEKIVRERCDVSLSYIFEKYG